MYSSIPIYIELYLECGLSYCICIVYIYVTKYKLYYDLVYKVYLQSGHHSSYYMIYMIHI